VLEAVTRSIEPRVSRADAYRVRNGIGDRICGGVNGPISQACRGCPGGANASRMLNASEIPTRTASGTGSHHDLRTISAISTSTWTWMPSSEARYDRLDRRGHEIQSATESSPRGGEQHGAQRPSDIGRARHRRQNIEQSKARAVEN